MNYLFSHGACSPIVTLILTHATFDLDFFVFEIDFKFFFGAPLPDTCKGSSTLLNATESTSGAYDSTGPYLLPLLSPPFGRFIAASSYRTCFSRSYDSSERDAAKAAA